MNGKKLVLPSLLVITFLLRLPSLFEPYWYGDEGIYLTMGQALRKGLVFYRDIHDNKPPFLYILAAISGTQSWFRMILLFWNLFNVWLIYKFARLIFKRYLIAFVSGLFFIIFSLLPEGNIANGEIFMIMPVTAGMLLITQNAKIKNQNDKSKIKIFFLAGMLFSFGFLFKAPAAFSFLAALIFLVFFQDKFNLKKQILTIWQLFLGFSLLPALSFIYYYFQGAFPQYVTAAFKQNAGYVSSWNGAWGASLFSLQSGLTWRAAAVILILAGLYLLKNKLKPEFLLLAIWFIVDLFAGLLSGRPYPHYLIQVAPALSILICFIFVKNNKLVKILAASAMGVLIAAILFFRFWHYPVWSYYWNFSDYLLGRKTKAEYFTFFDKRVNQTYELASLVKYLTLPDDSIFVWGDEPYIYALSDRLPPGRYTVAYHVNDFNGWQETKRAIELKQPKLIIMMPGAKSFPDLDKIIAYNYKLIIRLNKTLIYQKQK